MLVVVHDKDLVDIDHVVVMLLNSTLIRKMEVYYIGDEAGMQISFCVEEALTIIGENITPDDEVSNSCMTVVIKSVLFTVLDVGFDSTNDIPLKENSRVIWVYSNIQQVIYRGDLQDEGIVDFTLVLIVDAVIVHAVLALRKIIEAGEPRLDMSLAYIKVIR